MAFIVLRRLFLGVSYVFPTQEKLPNQHPANSTICSIRDAGTRELFAKREHIIKESSGARNKESMLGGVPSCRQFARTAQIPQKRFLLSPEYPLMMISFPYSSSRPLSLICDIAKGVRLLHNAY